MIHGAILDDAVKPKPLFLIDLLIKGLPLKDAKFHSRVVPKKRDPRNLGCSQSPRKKRDPQKNPSGRDPREFPIGPQGPPTKIPEK